MQYVRPYLHTSILDSGRFPPVENLLGPHKKVKSVSDNFFHEMDPDAMFFPAVNFPAELMDDGGGGSSSGDDLLQQISQDLGLPDIMESEDVTMYDRMIAGGDDPMSLEPEVLNSNGELTSLSKLKLRRLNIPRFVCSHAESPVISEFEK